MKYILALVNIPEDSLTVTQMQQEEPDSTQNIPDIQTARRLIRFMDEMPGGFLIYQADDKEEIIYANKALLRICQCSTLNEFREFTGNSFKGFVYPQDLEAVEESIRQQIAESRYDLDYVEYRMKRKDGEIRWIEDYGHFIHTHTIGNIFYVFISDATEKKLSMQAQMQLQEHHQKEKHLKTLLHKYHQERSVIHQEHLRRLEVIEGLSINYDSILYADLDADQILPYRLSSRTIVQFEKTFEPRLFSWYVSDYIETWVHPEDRKHVRKLTSAEYIRKKLAHHKTYYLNYRVLKDSKIQYLQLRIVNVGNRKRISQIVMGYRRVDDEIKREMEQKALLENALNNANLAITAKNTFLSNMSHDIRTPLNAIFGFTALAKSHLQNKDEVTYYLDKINASSEQLLDLIDKVLEFTWSDTDNIRVIETECCLTKIMEHIKHTLMSQAAEKNIELTMDSSSLTHCDIYSDPDKLEKLFLYLAHNAIKYTQNGGRVSISAAELQTLPDNYASYQFIVEDNGIGISKDFIDRIYKPFEREKNTTFSGVLGTGLGLTIVKNIVDAMDGTIEAQSVLGTGSKFTVTLRFRIQNHPPVSEMSIEDTIACLAKQKILLVEDNEINLEIETAILEGLGFDIDTATDGKIAVEMMKKARPDDYALILMDIQMPVMNGHQAAQAIRRMRNKALSRIPIIALSADAFESDKRKSLESGMDAHLSKPINVPVLLETVAKTLQSHKYLYGNKPDS